MRAGEDELDVVSDEENGAVCDKRTTEEAFEEEAGSVGILGRCNKKNFVSIFQIK